MRYSRYQVMAKPMISYIFWKIFNNFYSIYWENMCINHAGFLVLLFVYSIWLIFSLGDMNWPIIIDAFKWSVALNLKLYWKWKYISKYRNRKHCKFFHPNWNWLMLPGYYYHFAKFYLLNDSRSFRSMHNVE